MAKELKGKRKKVKGTAKAKVQAGKKKKWYLFLYLALSFPPWRSKLMESGETKQSLRKI